jgi:hypothetical protein
MDETYFNHSELVNEAARLSKDTTTVSEDICLSVPNKLEEIIRHEAFYCRASEDEMPSRMVLHGASIVSLIARGVYIDFQYDRVPDPEMPGHTVTSHIPLSFPRPEETEKITHVADAIKRLSDDRFEIRLNSLASALLENVCNENGLSSEINFVAIAGLINYIGIAERAGMYLSVYPDSDPRFKIET